MVNKLRYDPLYYLFIGIQVLLSEHIEHYFSSTPADAYGYPTWWG
jgi:hypothetical protein